VYDWVKPSLASWCITWGRVNASERKSTSGCSRFTSAITHSQNAKGLVCGLSTRKIATPSRAQCRNTSRNACQSERQAGVSKASG
jgi:hypothetical protein